MSNRTVNIGVGSTDGDLSVIISELCQEATDEEYERGKARARKAAKMAEATLHETSPKRTGKYAKGWTTEEHDTSRGFSVVVRNKTKPGITHLLEKGHMTRKGNRTKELPHIAPAYEKAKRLLEDENG